MLKLISVAALVFCAACACAEPSQADQSQEEELKPESRSAAADNFPIFLLTLPRANSNVQDVQGFGLNDEDGNEDGGKTRFQNINDHDDYDGNEEAADDDGEPSDETEANRNAMAYNEDDYNDNDDDDNGNDVTNNLAILRSPISYKPLMRTQQREHSSAAISANERDSQLNAAQLVLKQAKPTNIMVSRNNAGALMVPDGYIEIEGRSVVDERTGQTSLLVSRSALAAIPEGSVVALVDRSSSSSEQDAEEEARANRVIVRRRRRGSRRNVVSRRRVVNRRRGGGGNRRRRIRVYRMGGGNANRNRNRNRRRVVGRPLLLQG